MDKLVIKMIDQYRKKELKYENVKEVDIRNPDDFNVVENSENDEESDDNGFHSLIEHMVASGFSENEITSEVRTFLVAGYETVISAIDCLLFLLAFHTDNQKMCRDEVDALFQGANVKCLEMEDLTKLKYLERCILEGLRLMPTAPVIGRSLKAPLKITDEWTLNAGDYVGIDISSVHREEKIYENAEKFDPDRFLPESVKKRHPYAYIPFSMGSRNCIGWKLALLHLKVILAGILRNYEISTTDKPGDVKLLYYVTLTPERPYNLTFTRR